MPTQEKVETVEELKTRLDGVTTVLLAEYRGLTVQQLAELRKQLPRGVGRVQDRQEPPGAARRIGVEPGRR